MPAANTSKAVFRSNNRTTVIQHDNSEENQASNEEAESMYISQPSIENFPRERDTAPRPDVQTHHILPYALLHDRPEISRQGSLFPLAEA
jgi:hypothetical protein